MRSPGLRPGQRALVVGAVLTVVALTVYWNALQGSYHLDDIYRIANNPEVERVWPPWRHFLDPSTSAALPTIVQYRPLLPLTLSLTAWVGDAFGIGRELAHRLGNLGIHIATTAAILSVFRGLLARRWAAASQGRRESTAWTAALLYLVHPVAGVGVNYLCLRDLLMMQAFVWLGLWSILRLDRLKQGGLRTWIPVACVAAAALAKTNAIMAPACFGLVAWLGLGMGLGRGREGRLLRIWVLGGFTAMAAFLLWVRYGLSFSDLDQTVVERQFFDFPRTQLALHLVHYARNFVWPFAMRPLPDVALRESWGDATVWAGFAAIAGAGFVAWHFRRRAPLVTLAIAAYFVSVGPTTSLVSMRQLAADYRQLPGLPWLCLLVAMAIDRWAPKPARRSIAALLLLYVGGCSVLLNEVWRTDETLWAQSVRHGGTPQAHVNYALAVAPHDPRTARSHYREALRRAPRNVFAHINLGLLDIATGRIADGVERLEHANALAPSWAITREWRTEGCRRALRAPAAEDARTLGAVQRCREDLDAAR